MANQKWEYLIVRIEPRDEKFTQEQLASVGNEGWELVAVTPAAGTSVEGFFKRSKAPEGNVTW